MTDLRDTLSHVLWIGGAPQAGKTTLSRRVAGKYDLAIYNLDWHGAREHGLRAGPATAAFARLTMDQRWVEPDVPHLVERSIAVWSELFALVIDDLLARPRNRMIVAEGPGAFPWSVAPVIASPRQAIFLVPTPEFRERIAERRWRGTRRFDGGTGISDQGRAESNIRARDELLGERIAASCADLALRCQQVDGSLDLDASLELLEGHFGPLLPKVLNV